MPTSLRKKNVPRAPAPIYLKEWLEFKKVTAEELALRMETSPSVISKLASGEQRWNQDWLEMIAYALLTLPTDLLRKPDDLDAREVLRRIRELTTTPDQ